MPDPNQEPDPSPGEPPTPGGTGAGRDPHVAGYRPPAAPRPDLPIDPQPLNAAVDPAIYHPTEGIDPNDPAAGTVDPQQQIHVPPESRAPQNTGLDQPQPPSGWDPARGMTVPAGAPLPVAAPAEQPPPPVAEAATDVPSAEGPNPDEDTDDDVRPI